MTTITGKSYIAGNWIAPAGEAFQSFNPRSQEAMNHFTSCGSDEIEQALQQAANAYQQYRDWSGEQIADFLNAIAEEIEELGDELLQVGDSETGLGIPRLTGERARTCGQLRAFAQIASKGEWVRASIDTAIPDRTPVPKPDIRRMLRPIGPVVVFGASNFPFAFSVAGGDTASALAAGNPVVVKGHPAHPATSELFTQAIDRAAKRCNAPDGIFSMLQGTGYELGTELVKHPITQAVGFTGSIGGGRALLDIAAQREQPIPVYAEMGSINPIFIGAKTLASQGGAIVPNLSGSVCMGTGQFCTSPGLVVTVANSQFETDLKQALTAADRGILLNQRIASALSDGIQRLNNHPDVEWLNEAEFAEGSMTPPNSVFKTTAKAFLADASLSEEVFGPVTLLVICEDETQMLEVAEKLEGNLTGSIHADEDPELATKLTPILEQKVGRVIYNGFPTGVDVNPSMQHGGPYPASSVAWSTSVGADAIVRFARFVAYQGMPQHLLPDALKDENPLGIFRLVNNELTQDTVS